MNSFGPDGRVVNQRGYVEPDGLAWRQRINLDSDGSDSSLGNAVRVINQRNRSGYYGCIHDSAGWRRHRVSNQVKLVRNYILYRHIGGADVRCGQVARLNKVVHSFAG